MGSMYGQVNGDRIRRLNCVILRTSGKTSWTNDGPMKKFYPVVLLFVAQSAYSQSQVCPLNSNWSLDNLTHWFAYTGNNAGGNGPGAIKQRYDSTVGPPGGTLGAQSIQEYQLPAVLGIQVLANSTVDPYGGFATGPKIN